MSTSPDHHLRAVLARGDQQLRRAVGVATQPRPNVADQLERFTPRFDELIHRARLATTTNDFESLEEEAAAIGRDLRAVFRKPTPRAVPLLITKHGALF